MLRRLRFVLAPLLSMLLIVQTISPALMAQEASPPAAGENTEITTEEVVPASTGSDTSVGLNDPDPVLPTAAPTDVPILPVWLGELQVDVNYWQATCESVPRFHLDHLLYHSDITKVEYLDEWENLIPGGDISGVAGETIWVKVTFAENRVLGADSHYTWETRDEGKTAQAKVVFADAPTEYECATKLIVPEPALKPSDDTDAPLEVNLEPITSITGIRNATVEGNVVAGNDVRVRITFEDGYALDRDHNPRWHVEEDGTAISQLSIPGEGEVANRRVGTPAAAATPAAGTPVAEPTRVTLPAPDVATPDGAETGPVVETDAIAQIDGVAEVTVEGDVEPGAHVVVRATFEDGSTLNEDESDGWVPQSNGSALYSLHISPAEADAIAANTNLAVGITGFRVEVTNPDANDPNKISGVTGGQDALEMHLTYSVVEPEEGRGILNGDGFDFVVEGFSQLGYSIPEDEAALIFEQRDGQPVEIGMLWIDVDGTAHVRFTNVEDEPGVGPPTIEGNIWIEQIADWAAEMQQDEDVRLNFAVNTQTNGRQAGFVVVPERPNTGPTEPGIVPVKSGAFTRGDEGRAVHEGAIEWTIQAPAGAPTARVVMTDTVPVDPQGTPLWTFDCDTIQRIGEDSIASDGQMSITCAPDGRSLTIEITNYSAPTVAQAPGIRILADVKTINTVENPHQEHLTFVNAVTSTTYDEENQPINAGGTTTPAQLKQREIGSGYDPAKLGAWVDADQGRTRDDDGNAAGAFYWDIRVPSGPSNGVTLVDTAQEGWTFYCPNGSASIQQVAGVQVDWSAECSPAGVIVTVGPYAAYQLADLPVFRVYGTVIAPQPAPEYPRQVITPLINTVESTFIATDGGIYEGSGDAQLAQDPPAVPAVNPDKTGGFARRDNGMVIRDGAIRWTIAMPAGPNHGAVLTDLVPQGEDWEFACPATVDVSGVTFWTGGSGPAHFDADRNAPEIECGPTGLTVTFYNGYASGQPVITINANVTREFQNGKWFTNSATTRVLDYLVDSEWGDENGWSTGTDTHSAQQRLFQGGDGTRGVRGEYRVSIGDYVWWDTNRNGVQDAGEPPAGGITVTLIDPDGPDGPRTTTTNANGYYYFDNLDSDAPYQLRFLKPGPIEDQIGWDWTIRGGGDENSNAPVAWIHNDSNVDADGVVNFLTPSVGRNRNFVQHGVPTDNPTLDAGLIPVVSVGNYVWIDENLNGLQDAAEPPMPGVTVELWRDGVFIKRTTTDASGFYVFTSLQPGATYELRFTAPANYGWTQQVDGEPANDSNVGSDGRVTFTAPASGLNSSVPAEVDDPTIDAGMVRLVSVGDYVWLDVNENGVQDAGEPPVPGVVVTLQTTDGPRTTTTNANGFYSFTNLYPAREYSLAFAKPTFMDRWTAQGVDDGSNLDPTSWVNNDSNVDTNGLASFTSPLTGNNSASTPDNPTLDAGLITDHVSIGDRIWLDANRNGVQDAGETNVSGAVVTLFTADGTQVATRTTGSNGLYWFTGLVPGGSYYLTVRAPQNMSWTQPNASADDRDSDVIVASPLDSTGRIDFNAPNMQGQNRPWPSQTYTHGMADDPTFDGGLVNLVSVGDYVWFDYNQDGIQRNHPREEPVAGVIVWLLNADGSPVMDSAGNARVTTTNSSGFYSFNNLYANTPYILEFERPEQYDAWTLRDRDSNDALDSDVDPATGRIGFTSPASGRNSLTNPQLATLDAGLIITSVSVGDYVWYDTNRNGVQDAGELPATNITVVLKDAGGAQLETTVTNANGYYYFTDLEPGATYILQFGPVEGYIWTVQNAGADATDSDVNANGQITFAAPPFGGNKPWGTNPYTKDLADDPTLDAGLIELVSVGDRVWLDENRNGLQDAREPNMPGVLVELFEVGSDTPIATFTTGDDGAYWFTNLKASASYRIVFHKPVGYNWTIQGSANGNTLDGDDSNPNSIGVVLFTAPATGDNRPGFGATDNPTIDAGLVPVVSIGNYVWLDDNRNGVQDIGEQPKSGINVSLFQANGTLVETTVTNSDGHYVFTSLAPEANYYLVFQRPANLRWTLQNAGADEARDSDVNSQGRVDFRTPASGSNAADPLAVDNPDLDAGLISVVSIGDRVWLDTNRDGRQGSVDVEPGVANVTVNLFRNGTQVATTTTDSAGYYAFTDLDPSTQYRVQFVHPGGGTTWTTPNIGDSLLDSNVDEQGWATLTTPASGSNGAGPNATDNPTIDAGLVTAVSIGDYVWLDANRNGIQDSGESPAPGVLVWLYRDGDSPRSTVTNAQGFYSFNNLVPGGTYRLQFTREIAYPGTAWTVQGTGDNPNDSDVSPSGSVTFTAPTSGNNLTAPNMADNPRLDAGLVTAVSIGDYVWYDTDRDGIQDPREPAAAGIGVTLVRDGATVATTTTNSAGYYWFVDLEPGAGYSLRFHKPENGGWDWTVRGAGTDVNNSDVAPNGEVTFAAPASGSNWPGASLTDNPRLDAGLVPVVSVGNYVWLDANRDGVQDDDEDPVASVTVNLYLDDELVGTTMTDADGYYAFTSLIPATGYEIGFVKPATGFDWTAQGSDAGSDTDSNVSHNGRASLTTPAGGDNLSVPADVDDPSIDAGLVPVVSVGNYVWLDANRDGVQDTDEAGVAGVTVNLYLDGELIGTTTTDANGYYAFISLIPDTAYQIEFVKPATGFDWTVQGTNAGSDTDSNVGQNGRAQFSTPASGDNLSAPTDVDDPSIDAGLVPVVSVGNDVWLDANRDGVQDGDETGVESVTVNLYLGDKLVGTTTTDANGYYAFTSLIPNTAYQIEFVKPVLEGHAGWDWTIQGTELASDTDSNVGQNGRAQFTTPESGDNLGAPADVDDPSIDAGLVPVVSIGDYVWRDLNRDGIQGDGEAGVAGVTVNIYLGDELVGTTTTDANGYYAFTSLIPDTGYRLQFALPATVDTYEGWEWTTQAVGDDRAIDSNVDATGRAVVTTPNRGDNLATPDDADEPAIDAGIVLVVSVGDYVWRDLDRNGIQSDDETGVEGVTVNIYLDDDLVATTTTDAHGYYAFTSLVPGTEYHIQFILPATVDGHQGWEWTGQAVGEDRAVDSNVDATGWTLVTTATRGDNLDTPDEADTPTIDAGIVPVVSLGDYVWRDLDRNGAQNDGETGVEGVTVSIYLGDELVETTTTDADGYYAFTSLIPDTEYRLQFGLPTDGDGNIDIDGYQGWEWTVRNQGDSASDSDVDATGTTTVTTPNRGDNLATPGEADQPTVDAGIVPVVSIGDYVWFDTNRDGVQDESEPGASDVTVNLYRNGELVGTTTTDGDGYYAFTSVIPGTEYELEFVSPAAKYIWTTPGVGDDRGADSNVGSNGRTVATTPERGDNLAEAGLSDDPSLDAGLLLVVSIGDRVWHDVDRDGLQDSDEPGVPGVTVIIYGPNGAEVGRTTTDVEGYYAFDNLVPGTGYTLEFQKPDGFSGWSTRGTGDNADDSDVDTEGRVSITTPDDGENQIDAGEADNPRIDAGLIRLVSIGDRVWHDANRNGIQNEGEGPVAGVVVTLYGPDGEIVGTAVTDESGYYSFQNLLPDTEYSLEFAKPDGFAGWTIRGEGDIGNDSDVDINGRVGFRSPASGKNLTGADVADNPRIDAGLIRLVSVGDFVWYDVNRNGIKDAGEKPATGIPVHLYQEEKLVGSTVTDNNGYYFFQDLLPGTGYTLVFVKPDGFNWAIQNAGGDSTLDSDVNTSGYVTFTTPELGNNLVGANATDNPTLDAGLVVIESDTEGGLTPVTPTATPVEITGLPGTGSGATRALLGAMVASIAGLMLAAVAIRMNASKRS